MLEERTGPNAMEKVILAKLAELVPQRDAEKDRLARKELNRRITELRKLGQFCRTRAGYVASDN